MLCIWAGSGLGHDAGLLPDYAPHGGGRHDRIVIRARQVLRPKPRRQDDPSARRSAGVSAHAILLLGVGRAPRLDAPMPMDVLTPTPVTKRCAICGEDKPRDLRAVDERRTR